jgi:competence protein ComEC
VSAPLIVLLSGQVSLVAVPANMLVAPVIAPATVLGVLSAVASVLWLPLARFLAWVGGLAASWVVWVAQRGADLPYAAIPWPGGPTGAIALTGFVIVGAGLLSRLITRRIVLALVTGVVVGAGTLRVLAPGWPPRDWLMVACDVGQGDALALRVGPGAAALVDTGPDPGRVDRCLDALGVRRVPVLVLSHMHADHVDGLPGVIDGRRVGTVLVNSYTELPHVMNQVATTLTDQATTVRRVTAGERYRVGSVRLQVLGPTMAPEISAEESEESSVENNASVVMKAIWPGAAGATVLLTGDIEPEAQTALLSSDLRADVLKVPHHGSSRQDPRFLAAVGAQLALISAGAHNDYGHPAPTTLRLLRELGMRSYRTDEEGDVAVISSGSGLAVLSRSRSTDGIAPAFASLVLVPLAQSSPHTWHAALRGSKEELRRAGHCRDRGGGVSHRACDLRCRRRRPRHRSGRPRAPPDTRDAGSRRVCWSGQSVAVR